MSTTRTAIDPRKLRLAVRAAGLTAGDRNRFAKDFAASVRAGVGKPRSAPRQGSRPRASSAARQACIERYTTNLACDCSQQGGCSCGGSKWLDACTEFAGIGRNAEARRLAVQLRNEVRRGVRGRPRHRSIQVAATPRQRTLLARSRQTRRRRG